jgi:hypothetical protein
MPTTFGTSAVSSTKYSIYANYTATPVIPLPPAAPTSLTANAVSTSQINLTWTDNAANEQGFEIERSLTSGSGFQLIYTTGPDATSFSDIGLDPLQTYFYRIRAYNAQGPSDYTDEQQATTLDPGAVVYTIGNNQIFSSTSTTMNRRAQPVTMTETGTISSIAIYHGGGTGNLILAVYNNAGTLPGQRIATTPTTAVNSAAGWQTINLITPVEVTQGSTIWLAWVFQNTVKTRYTSGTPGRAQSSALWAGGMPTTFGTSAVSSTKYSIYANYTVNSTKSSESGNVPIDKTINEPENLEFTVYPTLISNFLNVDVKLPTAQHAVIRIYDITGKRIMDLLDGYLEPGMNRLKFDDLSIIRDNTGSNVLFIQLILENKIVTRKLIMNNN